jgi:hypothetical protein
MPYKRCVIKTTVINDGDGNAKLDIPVRPSAVTVVRLGEMVTYRLRLHVGEEVLALIGYSTPMPQELKDFNKQFGAKWSDIKNDPDYTKHWPYTKETAWGTWDWTSEFPVFIPYNGPDKNDPVKFKQWDE